MGVHVIRLPDVGEGVAEAEIVEWSVKPGDKVRADDILGAVMTDKATVEIPSPVDGEVNWLGGEVGEVVAVGSDFVKLTVEGEGAADDAPAAPTAKAEPAPVAAPEPSPKPEPEVAAREASPALSTRPVGAGAPRPEGEKPTASPAVRQRARDMGLDLRAVRGTGPAGRILHEDLDAYAHGSSSVGGGALVAARGLALAANTDVETIKVVGMRRKIAEKMAESKRRIAHFSYVEEVDVTALEELRAHLNDTRAHDQPKLTVLPLFIRALVAALRDFPQMSARYDDDAGVIEQFGAAHVGIATQTDNGLMVPVIRHAEARDIWDLAEAIKRLADAARSGKATREELTGSSITLTSLGPLGGVATTPVVNYPEVAIVGPNKIVTRPVWRDGEFVPRQIMNISSSFDHRVIDGADAAAFIQRIKQLVEHPATIFM